MRAMALARAQCVDLSEDTRARIDRAVLAWAAAPLLTPRRRLAGERPAIRLGADLVDGMTEAIAQSAVAAAQRGARDHAAQPAAAALIGDDATCAEDHVIVCRREIEGSMAARANDVVRPHAHVVNAPVALAPCPDLSVVRSALLAEFPYAAAATEFCLAGLVGRRFVQFEPLLLVGPPGCGKTRFVSRLCELLEVGLWRIDATQADGGAIAGTDKRWATASPCAPLLAISRFRRANPVILVDEVEKAATRADYGRLWDALVALCERENTTAYPDPAIGAPVNVSWVAYIATANSVSGLPGPLVDRFRIVEFDSPRAQDLDRLAERFRLDLARERRIDDRFISRLTPDERDMLARQWRGGSARRLRRMLDVIWRFREKNDVWH